MSSLTSIGVNKNKKSFAPTAVRRKERKPASTQPVEIQAQPPTLPATIGQPTHTTRSVPPITAAPTHTTSSIPPIVAAPSPSAILPKEEPLTQEELAINANSSQRKRPRPTVPVIEEPSHAAPRVAAAPSPIDAPSPMAPIERPDCRLDASAPLLKIERMTPDVRTKLNLGESSGQPTTQPAAQINTMKKDEDENRDEALLASDDEEIDIQNNTPEPITAPSPPPITPPPITPPPITPPVPKKQTAKRTQPRRAKTPKPAITNVPETSTGSRSSSRQAKVKATEAIASQPALLEDDSDDNEEAVIITAKPAKKNKGKGKPSTAITPGSSNRATPVSISIGVPSQTEQQQQDSYESCTTDSDEEIARLQGRRTKRAKRTGQMIRKPHKFAYRLVENMRTLDDITDDLNKIDNLDKPMSTFTKDVDGIVSKAFKEMETAREAKKKTEEAKKTMSPEELEALKKKEEAEEAEVARQKLLAKEKDDERRRREAENVLAESSNAVQVRLVNGEIVLDTDTLTVERTAPESSMAEGAMEVVEENSMTRRVNSATYGKRKASSKWDDAETQQFYECLSQFGTDFEMISIMMPGRTRNQIRLKYNREERLHPEKVTEYMISKRKPMDIDKYKEMAGIDTLEAVPEDFHEMQLG
ncbi:uncharacterized protein B0P05DRAFT_570730 [Gilbertella persicaria]|uniref:Transcription factor TFIIIB component B n=1 Tax=Rhizopus stolonifer TaxID=4846 RepID=A0A367K5K7_RHIST|nr:uncharacterized protein B0P05DRAFT_570730 [Gilbertella persicaria]KAI8083413.1 hypothetical protein B0P05DRAFT_570730 [Gilbertella persicaria]RCH97542.1 Transcription factor TFIIIB component B [Rhizopus stolonifer]